MLVYIPVVQHNPTLIPIVKYKYKEDRWETGDPAPNIVTSDFDVSAIHIKISTM